MSKVVEKRQQLRCPDCNRFVSEKTLYSELDHLDPDESPAQAWFEYVWCRYCCKNVCLGLAPPL